MTPTPILKLVDKTLKPRVSPDALAWRNLRTAAVALVNKRRLMANVSTSVEKLAEAVQNMARIDVTPIAKQVGEEVDLAALVNALLTDLLQELADVLSDIQDRTVVQEQASIKENQVQWSTWAANATLKSSGAGHSFTRAKLATQDDPDCNGTPASRDAALGIEALKWLPLWQDVTKTVAGIAQKVVELGVTLPPLTVENLDSAARSYKSVVGHGIDCTNPAAMQWLPQDLKLRFLDLLHLWEAAPELPLE